MDLIYQRYANPLELLGNMIRMSRFSEFVRDLLEIYQEEREDRIIWELWLHKVDNMEFKDFMATAKEKRTASSDEPSSRADIEETIKDSWEILDNFCL